VSAISKIELAYDYRSGTVTVSVTLPVTGGLVGTDTYFPCTSSLELSLLHGPRTNQLWLLNRAGKLRCVFSR
jgi:hypothetical protein